MVKEVIEVRAKVDVVVNVASGDLGKIFLVLDEFVVEKIDEEYFDDGFVYI